MKKWIFILGILCCSVLFFLSGTLIGYSVREDCNSSSVRKNEKKKRIPSAIIGGLLSPLVDRVVDNRIARIQSRLRTPSQPAIEKANGYR
ncbi:MAG: hypothetical protein LBU35_00145 [Holosporales bacterium]|jgi:hypothetical protein|nr:hypothetical protein [Holosporales bacterium]